MSQVHIARRSLPLSWLARGKSRKRHLRRIDRPIQVGSGHYLHRHSLQFQPPSIAPTFACVQNGWWNGQPLPGLVRCFLSSSSSHESGNNDGDDEEAAKREIPMERRLRSSRRVVAQLVPQWMKSEPFCFERTVSALNLTLSSERYRMRTSFTAKSADLSGQYRKVFLDSIPSFTEYLKTSDNLPEQLKECLDRLVEAGFGDREFAKLYREVKGNEQQHAQKAALLSQKRKQYEERQRTMQLIAEKVEEMKEELALVREEYDRILAKAPPAVAEKRKRGSNDDSSSVVDMISSAARMAGAPEDASSAALAENDTERNASALEQRIAKLDQRIEAREAHVDAIDRGAQGVLEAIDNLQQELEDSQRRSMSSETYAETQQVVNETLLVLCDYLAEHIQTRHASLIERWANLDSKTDLTKPHEWYQLARLDKRKIVMHLGPTNSGKTYNALQRLKQAKSGLYVGPLRLLAAEVYETLNSQGVYTSLLTGQERREYAFCTHVAATIEMASNLLEREFEVVVIDEIQMIEDKERGYAWTRALMGIRSKEIHVCGGLEARTLVERIAKACNDDFELFQYERFSELTVSGRSLANDADEMGAYKRVRPGDCIVAFSRNDIFAIQREVEASGQHKCCIVYGTLPPEIRTAQAQLFNDPDSGYDVLVASDAIAMGLNLNIRRIIFNTIYKNDGGRIARLGHSAVKQIAGRAGRRNSQYPEGEVTCRDPRDLEYIQECLDTEIAPVEKAGLIPTAAHIDRFGEALQEYHWGGKEDANGNTVVPHLHMLLTEFSDMAVVKGSYFLCRQKDMVTVAKWLRDIPLETKDKFVFCMAPVNTSTQTFKEVIQKFGKKLAAGEVPGLTRGSVVKRANSFSDLAKLCSIYLDVELFIWMQNKFPPVNLMEQQAALARKERASTMIKLALQEAKKLKLNHCYITRDANLRSAYAREQEESEEDGTDVDLDGEATDGEVIGYVRR